MSRSTASHFYGFALILPCVLLAVGCGGPRRGDYVSTARISMPADHPAQQQLWEAIAETLREEGFRLDRLDQRAGLVTTFPETSKHFFEFWRHDVDTRQDFWEATINPIRRAAEVSLQPSPGDAAQELTVVVRKEQLSSPDRQFNSTIAAYQIFGNSLPSTTGMARITPEHDYWFDCGRDEAMEDYLRRRILARANLDGATGANTDGAGNLPDQSNTP